MNVQKEIPSELVDEIAKFINTKINIPFLTEDMEYSLIRTILTFLLGLIDEFLPDSMKK